MSSLITGLTVQPLPDIRLRSQSHTTPWGSFPSDDPMFLAAQSQVLCHKNTVTKVYSLVSDRSSSTAPQKK
ncbi:MAG: hypothetical protein ACO34J_11005, partial [Prochlorothrix sp.]